MKLQLTNLCKLIQHNNPEEEEGGGGERVLDESYIF